MDARALLRLFSSLTTLPIDPDDVAKEIKKHGIKDEIEFIGVSMETLVLRGSLFEYVRPSGMYSEPVVCAEVYYSLNYGQDWKRFVCCKELIHLLDRTPSKTTTKEGVERLVRDMADAANMASINAANLASWTDHLTELYAAAVLFPFEAREVLLPAFRDSKITLSAIASRADLPLPVVEIVMSDQWPVIYEALCGLK